MKLYGGEAGKISVVHHGFSFCHSGLNPESKDSGSRIPPSPRLWRASKCGMTLGEKPYLFYLGRIETKKNIQGILEAYKILKEKYKIPHKLVLAGAPGYGYKNLKLSARGGSALGGKIEEFGYVDEKTKWRLFSGADIFLSPSFYEGFGLPVLEAQAAGVPVITSANSCLPEIAGQGALFVNPANPAQIAEAVKQVIDDSRLRDKLRQLGFENVKRFDWGKCARNTLEVITKMESF